MKTSIKNTKKHYYNSPQIERIVLDNEISLILQSESDAPEGEPSVYIEHFTNDPFKNNIG